jgi:uncharacterized membrane protein (UPF0127 family)
MENGYIYIDNNIFPTLFAISEEEQCKGLMHEPFPPPIMSFVYNESKVTKFWMHNTPSPLDIVFCCKGYVKQICSGEPYSTSIIGTDDPSDLIIEFPSGTVKNVGIKFNHKVGIVVPTEFELRKIIAEKQQKIFKY